MIGQSADVRHHVRTGVAFAKVATSFPLRQHSVMVDAIPAATVIIVRDLPGGHEVLMIERHTQLAFAGGAAVFPGGRIDDDDRSEEHTSELQSLMRNSYAVFCLTKNTYNATTYTTQEHTSATWL